jgi:hypothetical protein
MTRDNVSTPIHVHVPSEFWNRLSRDQQSHLLGCEWDQLRIVDDHLCLLMNEHTFPQFLINASDLMVRDGVFGYSVSPIPALCAPWHPEDRISLAAPKETKSSDRGRTVFYGLELDDPSGPFADLGDVGAKGGAS